MNEKPQAAIPHRFAELVKDSRLQPNPRTPEARTVTIANQAITTDDLDILMYLDALVDAIDRLIDAVELTPTDHPDRAMYLANLAVAYQVRYVRTDVLADLQASIEFGEQAVAASAADEASLAGYLSNLALAYQTLYMRTGVLPDIQAAIDLGERAVALTPANAPNLACLLSHLEGAYLAQFKCTGILADAQAAINRGMQAVAAAPRNGPEVAAYLANVGAAHIGRYRRTRALDDLHAGIEWGERAVATAPAEDPARGLMLENLANAYMERFERTAALTDLQTGIEHGERAVATLAARRAMLSKLASAYRLRFDRTGALADLNAAIERGERSVTAIPDDDPDLAGHLSVLGAAYQERFECTGVLGDLHAGVERGERAVAASRANDPNRSRYLSNLAGAYHLRFEHTGGLADLQASISLRSQAMASIPAEEVESEWITSHNLAGDYLRRFERSGSAADIQTAIDLGERAMAACPTDSPKLGSVLSNLAGAYIARFQSARSMSDIQACITYGEQAVDVTPTGHARLASRLFVLALAYRDRFDCTGSLSDLEASITYSEDAVAATAAGHPELGRHLSNLAVIYQTRLWSGDGRLDGVVISRLAKRAAGLVATRPIWQVQVSYHVGALLWSVGQRRQAVWLLRRAVRALPSVAPRELDWADQEHRLGELAGVVGEVMSAHLGVGDTTGAVELAELGRGIVLSAQLDTRTDVTELETAAPELAAEFCELREELNSSSPDSVTGHSADVTTVEQSWATRRRGLASRWDRLLQDIRRRDGFESFLAPPQLMDLQQAAIGGAVVVVNAGQARSDAIVVQRDSVATIRLERLTLADLRSHASSVVPETPSVGSPAPGVTPELLAWLWETITQPVLDALGYHETPGAGQRWPRLWWVPIGLLGLLPLHAAGLPGGPSVLDRVVCSYAPTIRALLYSQRQPSPDTRRQLTVALQHTPGQPDLPGTVAEAAELHARYPDTAPLIDDTATTTNVLAALTRTNWVHFACHARSHPTTPSRSGLLLHDTALPVPHISRLRLEAAELAYLSACSTAQIGRRQPDEAIHLASAFQLAGYRHVIATLWPLHDAIAATAAHRFYQLMPNIPKADLAPIALHQLTQELRSDYPDHPDLWAPLIHNGP